MLTKSRKAELIARIKIIKREGERRQDRARARLEACEQFSQSHGHEATFARVGGRDAFLKHLEEAGARWPPGFQEWKLFRGHECPDKSANRPDPDMDPDIRGGVCFARAVTEQTECIEAHALIAELLQLHPQSKAVRLAVFIFVAAYFYRHAEPKALNLPPRPWPEVLPRLPGGQKLAGSPITSPSSAPAVT